MELSARNQLRGTVKSVYKGSVLAEVIVDVGGQEMVSTITRRSAERLNLSEGDTVVAIIKATEVMLGKRTGQHGPALADLSVPSPRSHGRSDHNERPHDPDSQCAAEQG